MIQSDGEIKNTRVPSFEDMEIQGATTVDENHVVFITVGAGSSP
jgi:hypothetical protein